MKVVMSGRVKLNQQNARDLKTAVMQQWVAQLNSVAQARLGSVIEGIKGAVREALLAATEFEKVKKEYRGECGLVNPDERINAIVEKLVDSIAVRLVPFRYSGRGTIAGKISIVGLPVDCRDVLGMSEAVVIDEKTGSVFQWLHALLFCGDEIVIQGYKYMSEVLSPESKAKARTGEGLMIQRDGRSWRVPPDISGTESDNLITRTLNSPAVQQTIETELAKLIG